MADSFHRRVLESNGARLAVLTTVMISIGALVEIVPMYSEALGPEPLEGVEPLTPLELAGRDIYIREGCYNCHSQMVRPFRDETLRYGPWTRAGELVYERPFQMGSRRIGPDLQRVGGKWGDDWHYNHMKNPRDTSPGSIMPNYPWLFDRKVDTEDVQASLTALQKLGTPYSDEDIANAGQSMQEQGQGHVDFLAGKGITAEPDDEIIAMIAYLQHLGVDGRAAIEKQAAAASDESPERSLAAAEE
ncbi:MAG: cytochrome-c oxidase, cbb3-type subunit II [Myxococcota bacterium]|nr:cytochrome-c oxidase, cbb3-type subunit II [Myxococcota bacterium]